MTVTLQPVFEALGYRDAAAQRAMVKLLQASGAFGDLPCADGVIDDKQAQTILTHVTFENPEQVLLWLHTVTQESMLRRPTGVERNECHEPEHFKQHRAAMLEALRQTGMLSEVKPSRKHYDHVLVLGAMEGAVDTRLDTLPKLWKDGVRFGQIHLLGSERPLEASEPMAQIAIDGGGQGTEMQMMMARAYEKSEGWPPEMQQVPIHPVNALQRENGQRANTRDTAEAWLKTNPTPGNVLIISNQPHIRYQEAAIASALPSLVQVESAGAAANENKIKISVALDSIARRIDAGLPRLIAALKDHKPARETPLAMFDPATIQVDAKTYQFRSGGDAKGVTSKGRYHAEQWDKVLHGDPLLVHERKDGRVFVADGHHRLELAKNLNEKGTGPGQVAAMVLREADGYTAQDVKIIAAYKNIAHGKTDPVDTARVFKEAEALPFDHKKLLPSLQMDKGNLRMSYSLSKLSDASLEKVAKGEVPAQMAAQVAERLPGDMARQDMVMGIIGEKLRGGFADKIKQQRIKTPDNGLAC